MARTLELLAGAGCACEAQPLELQRAIDADEQAWRDADRCERGAALARVAGAGVSSALCPRCDAERLDELEEPDLEGELSLSIELAQLGKEAAREVRAEHAGDARAVPCDPQLRADQPLTEPQRRVFEQAHRNELRVLADGGGRQHARDLVLAGALLALCLPVLAGCVQAHGRIEGPPLYMHLCAEMPAADQEAWGAAASALNAELEVPAVWVGHGPPSGCSTVDVCPSSAVLADAEVDVGTCVITVRYAPASAHKVARQELDGILDEL